MALKLMLENFIIELKSFTWNLILDVFSKALNSEFFLNILGPLTHRNPKIQNVTHRATQKSILA